MNDSPPTPSRLVASHLRDFADFLPENKREDFNATIDDLIDAQAKHIEKLQAKLPPLRDERPGYVPREG